MRTISIITEYNPLHNGHLKQIEYIHKQLGDDYKIIIFMSGNFVQRGEAAVLDKYTRAKLAIKYGASLVIEIPSQFSTASAREFARAGISLIHASGVSRDIICGAEDSDAYELFDKITDVLVNEPDEYKTLLEEKLASGLAFAKARELSLSEYLGNDEVSKLLAESNNILALEYLLAIKEMGLSKKLKLHLSPRSGDAELNDEIGDEQASASAVRKSLLGVDSKAELIASLEGQVPAEVLAKLLTSKFPQYKNLEQAILLRLVSADASELVKYRDVDEGLANRLINAARDYIHSSKDNEWTFLQKASTRYYPLSRIKRACLSIVLNIKENDWLEIKEEGPAFLNLLAADKEGKYLVKLMRKLASLPLVVKNSDLLESLNNEFNTSKIQQDNNLSSDSVYNILSENEAKGIFTEYFYIL